MPWTTTPPTKGRFWWRPTDGDEPIIVHGGNQFCKTGQWWDGCLYPWEQQPEPVNAELLAALKALPECPECGTCTLPEATSFHDNSCLIGIAIARAEQHPVADVERKP